MSSALAIAGVTAALRDLLNNGLIDHDLAHVGNFTVTASPPDRITAGQQEPNQLNVFLYQVSANPAWRNADLPVRDGGGSRLANPPLALDLHYLLTAYGSADMNAEILLGYAMQILHENPGLSRDQLRVALGGVPPVAGSLLPGPLGTLSAADLADQVETIKITPLYLTGDDLSKLWTAMQARYRPTMAYLVSVVLIQSRRPARSAPPVLRRGQADRGPVVLGGPAPVLLSARPAAAESLPAARLGDELLISGAGLEVSDEVTVVLESRDGDALLRRELPPLAVDPPARIGAQLPAIASDPEAMADWRVGLYQVSLALARPGLPVWRTNAVPIALAPLVAVDAAAVAPNAVATGADVSLTCSPRLTPRQQQSVRVLFGDRELAPKSVTTPADDAANPNNHQLPTTVVFTVPAVDAAGDPLVPGQYLVRLRVDGIDSLPVVFAGSPPLPAFDPQQKVNVA